jgi:hypothetical protein
MTAFATDILIPGGTGSAAWLKIILPFAISFPLGRLLIYAWMRKIDLQSPDFSPAASSVMSAPILTSIYFTLIFSLHSLGVRSLFVLVIMLVVFLPTFLFLSPLLAMYLFRAVRREELASRALLCAATLSCLIAQFLWFWCLDSVFRDIR